MNFHRLGALIRLGLLGLGVVVALGWSMGGWGVHGNTGMVTLINGGTPLRLDVTSGATEDTGWAVVDRGTNAAPAQRYVVYDVWRVKGGKTWTGDRPTFWPQPGMAVTDFDRRRGHTAPAATSRPAPRPARAGLIPASPPPGANH